MLLYTRLLEAETRTVQGEDGWADGLKEWSAKQMELHPEQLKVCVADPGAQDRWRCVTSESLGVCLSVLPQRTDRLRCGEGFSAVTLNLRRCQKTRFVPPRKWRRRHVTRPSVQR